jgi:hypothetical protein
MVHELDGTQNEWGWCKQKLGANAILAVSLAVCKAGALSAAFLYTSTLPTLLVTPRLCYQFLPSTSSMVDPMPVAILIHFLSRRCLGIGDF